MDTKHYAAYVVVKNLSNSRRDLDKYLCMPSSWIIVRDKNNSAMVVCSYPTEKRATTIFRVLDYEPLDKTWPLLKGEVVYDTDSQGDAIRYFKTMNESLEQTGEPRQSSENREEQGAEEINNTASTSSNTIKHSNKRINPLNATISKNKPKAKCQKISDFQSYILETEKFIQSLGHENNDEPTLDTATQEMTQDIIEDDKVENKENAETERQIRRSTRKTKPVPLEYLYDLSEDSDNSNDADYTSNETDTSLKADDAEPDSNIESLENANPLYNHLYSFHQIFCDEFYQSHRKVMSILDNAAASLEKVIIAHKNKNKSSINRKPLNNKTKDSKWTLRYPEPGQGLTELIPNTGVYVSESGLRQAEAENDEACGFGRALLAEIFSDKALRKCSFTGASAKAFKNKKHILPRPALDYNARRTMITYVYEYALRKGWDPEPKVFIRSIKNKLHRPTNGRLPVTNDVE